jgi:large subunit ribosomal protein L3
MIGLIGKKIGMSQIFKDNGTVIPVSVVKAIPCPILQIKNTDTDGYTALQLGIGKKKRVNKPIKGHLKKAKVDTIERIFEIHVTEIDKYKVGDHIDVSIFNDGDTISITGWTKGRGFSGGIKRWGWHGGPKSHGSTAHRRIGSAGPGSSPGRIWKGKTMPGRYGNERMTIKRAKVVKVDKKTHEIYIKGAVPGARNGYLILVKEEK